MQLQYAFTILSSHISVACEKVQLKDKSSSLCINVPFIEKEKGIFNT